MKLQFLGAAQTTTGSMHMLTVNGTRILMDCGLYQGRRAESFERNRNLAFDVSKLDVLSGLDEGVYKVRIIARDGAGNITSSDVGVAVRADDGCNATSRSGNNWGWLLVGLGLFVLSLVRRWRWR